MKSGPRPTMSVVLPVRNMARLLPLQLQALAAQAVDDSWELIVVDDASTDDSADIARHWSSEFPACRVVALDRQVGSAAARNAGMSAAHGGTLAFCDADDIVGEHWAAAMATGLRDHPMVTGPLDYAMLDPRMPATLGADHGRPGSGFLPHAATCNLGVRREVFDAVGPFIDWPAAYDTEFCWRAQLAGFELGWRADVLVHRRRRDTLYAEFVQHFRYGRESVKVAGRFAHLGLRPVRTRTLVRVAADRARQIGDLRSPGSRRLWIASVGWWTGRAIGAAGGAQPDQSRSASP